MATVTETLLTAEEYAGMPDPGYPTELVRGRVVTMSPPKPIHGWICNRISYLFTHFLMQNDLGQAYSNDTGVLTQRGPDTLRGADFSYYSYERVPRSTSKKDYFDVAPDLIFEVMSQGDREPRVLVKVAEYLEVGVRAVCVVDPRSKKAHLYRTEAPIQDFGIDDNWEAPEILPGLSIPVRQFFE
jgi:Uma2 family endonuclease